MNLLAPRGLDRGRLHPSLFAVARGLPRSWALVHDPPLRSRRHPASSGWTTTCSRGVRPGAATAARVRHGAGFRALAAAAPAPPPGRPATEHLSHRPRQIPGLLHPPLLPMDSITRRSSGRSVSGGSFCPVRPRANYTHTRQALERSLLNWEYLDSLVAVLGAGLRTGPRSMHEENNRAIAFLKALGVRARLLPELVTSPSGRTEMRISSSRTGGASARTPNGVVQRTDPRPISTVGCKVMACSH